MNENDLKKKIVELAFTGKEISQEDLKSMDTQSEDKDLTGLAKFIHKNKDLLVALEKPVPTEEAAQALKRAHNIAESSKRIPKLAQAKKKRWSFSKIQLLVLSSACMLMLALGFFGNIKVPSSHNLTGNFHIPNPLSNPEFPLFQLSNSETEEVPTAKTTVFALDESETPNKPLLKYRTSLLQRNADIPKERKALQEKLENIETKLAQKEQQQLLHQKALFQYLLANLEVEQYLKTGKWQNQKRGKDLLVSSQTIFADLLQSSNDQGMIYNYLAARITDIYFNESFSKDSMHELLSYVMQKPSQLTAFLFDKAGKLPKKLTWKKNYQNEHSVFLVSYLIVLNYAYFEEMAIKDLPDLIETERKRVLQVFTLLEQTEVPKKEYWYKEFQSMKHRIGNFAKK
ncbi:MAG: hypothetical protein AAF518_27070 [Spirochaetota bacterium]